MMNSKQRTGWSIAVTLGLVAASLLSTGCPGMLTSTTGANAIGNPFATLTDRGLVEANIETEASEISTGAAAGQDADLSFRNNMRINFVNTATDRELSTNFIAWVEPGNVRTETQRDALISSGYIEITNQINLGVAYVLVPGTFVFQGSGGSGLERVILGPTGAGQTVIPSESTIDLVTPDVLLVYLDPPTSCASTAFRFLDEGDVITEPAGGGGGTDGAIIFGGATNIGPNKTLGQIDAYQCDPFRPGLFFRQGGGLQQGNEFVEGDQITFTFLRFPVDENNQPSPDGNACLVTFAGATASVIQTGTDGSVSEDAADDGDATDDG